jgi:hypothetical protein
MSAAATPSREPWSQDPEDQKVVQDANREIAALAISVENARRIVASVNAVQKVSSESLDAGIVSEGLRCLALLCRYHTESDYRDELDRGRGFEKLLARGNAVWTLLKKETLYHGWT